MSEPGSRWFTGLRMRMAAAFTAIALLAAVLASGLSYVLLRRVTLQRFENAVLTEVRTTLARQIPPERPPDVTELLGYQLEEALGSEPGRKAAAVPVPVDGGVNLPPPGALDVPVTREFARRAMREPVMQRVVLDGEPYLLIGVRVTGHRTTAEEPWRTAPPMVFVSVSMSREAADLRLFTRTLVIAGALAVVAAAGFAQLAVRGVLRPVRRLGAAARALGAGKLETRVDVRGNDELADLSRTFNRTAEALERTVTDLRAMDAASRRFVADVSHELRTPLTSMLAATDVLADDGDAAARLVAAETRRLGRLVEHLIEISRFDAGRAALALEEVDVADAVIGTVGARGWRDRVTVDGPAGLSVRADPRRLDVVLANLAGNALEHGRQPVSVRFGASERNGAGGVEIVVADGGPGLPDDLLPVVFDRFVKAEAARSRSDGSGLGLSIARENALLHGGTLEAANGPDGGAVFTLWLPCREGDRP
ncbi:ATP-binding protein [Actinomadura welshii]